MTRDDESDHHINFRSSGNRRPRGRRQSARFRIIHPLASDQQDRGFAGIEHATDVGNAKPTPATAAESLPQSIEIRTGGVSVLFQPLK